MEANLSSDDPIGPNREDAVHLIAELSSILRPTDGDGRRDAELEIRDRHALAEHRLGIAAEPGFAGRGR